eukprot:TRINITY_DN18179_c0_g1_i2.p1 TRINITY_DN18179_c0_g1~~TRINITY_DN18179_c0_g1_i2.p1  ORF type:complete len:203 (-),score=51.84 TRINITY_DN18179_c0_g1_i2:94-702(-)
MVADGSDGSEITAAALSAHLQLCRHGVTDNSGRLAKMLEAYRGCDSDEEVRQRLAAQLLQTESVIEHEHKHLATLAATVKRQEAEAEQEHARCLQRLATEDVNSKTKWETILQCIDNEWDSYQTTLANIRMTLHQQDRLKVGIKHALKVLTGTFIVALSVDAHGEDEVVTCRNIAGEEILFVIQSSDDLQVCLEPLPELSFL